MTPKLDCQQELPRNVARLSIFAFLISMVVVMAGCLGTLPGANETDDAGDESGDGLPATMCTKEGALEYSLELMATYFGANISVWIDSLHDPVYAMEPWEMENFSRAEFAGFIGEYWNYYPDHTLDEYLETHDAKIFTYTEALEHPDWEEMPPKDDGWVLDEDDFIFVGTLHQNSSADDWFWNDLGVFAVTCENDRWEFIAA